ncbi:MAG: hypothetical protein EKK48_10185 [Candidatus Melainabacteria bacterium]|nr:MAG: hypothetical protein EKK48_10185 [Candidatus Melainabacteria bacterium]
MTALPVTNLNVRPDAPDLRDRIYNPTLKLLLPSLNDRPFSNPIFNELVKDQGDSQACTGFALSSMIEVLFKQPGRISEELQQESISAQMLYYYARLYDDIPGKDLDSGSTARAAMKAWFTNGAVSERLWGQNLEPPQLAWQQDAFSRPLGAYFRVAHTELSDMHAALNETELGMIFVSALVHHGWSTVSEYGFITYEPQAQIIGGHAFLIVGYDQVGFWFLNSWGKNWGCKGFARISYPDWLANGMDAWVAQLGVNVSKDAQQIHSGLSYERLQVAAGASALSANDAIATQIINPYILDLGSDGKLTGTGFFHTSESDVRELLTRYLPDAITQWKLTETAPIDIGLFAHEGLISQEKGATLAKSWIPKLFAEQIFPIFFMWETAKLRTVDEIYSDWLTKQGAGAAAYNLSGEMWNRRVETILATPGSQMWNDLKSNAMKASTTADGGLSKLIAILNDLPDSIRKRLRFHLIGHSAGAIFQSYLLQLLTAEELTVDSLYFLAPALTVKDFERLVYRHVKENKVRSYVQFHLSEDCERGDNCYPTPYTKSFLYLVSNSFEGKRETPIIGMKKFFDTYLENFPGLNPTIIESPNPKAEPEDARSAANRHDGFGSDIHTMNAIISRIKRSRQFPPNSLASQNPNPNPTPTPMSIDSPRTAPECLFGLAADDLKNALQSLPVKH